MAETLVTFMILLRKLDRMRWHERITIWKPTSRLFRSMGPTGRVRVVDYPGSVSDARHGTVAEATRFDPMTTFEQLNRT